MKLNNFQKLVLNTINAGVIDVGWLIMLLFGINYVKQLGVFISLKYHYWFTIIWGFSLIVLVVIFLLKSRKIKNRIKELTNK